MKQQKYIYILASLIIVLFSCKNEDMESIEINTESKDTENNLIIVTQDQFTESKMETGGFEEVSFPTLISANGIIDVPPKNKVSVAATMGGYIKSIPILEGDKVSKGDLLVSIENPEFVEIQQEYMEIHEQLTYLKSEYDRQVTMKAENITSQKNFLKAESDYKTAIAKYNGLTKQLEMLNISPSKVIEGNISSIANIYAPISGNITIVNITKGSYVSPSTQILEIIDFNEIHLELSVFEKDILKIKKGQKINFKIPETSERTYNGIVELIGASIDKNRTIKVHGVLENKSEANFLTGMFVEADIIIDSYMSKAVDSESIVLVDETPYVLILKKNEGGNYYFKKVKVEIEKTYNEYSIIKSEDKFEPNTQFLIKGAYSLL